MGKRMSLLIELTGLITNCTVSIGLVLSLTMFKKALPRALLRFARSFHTSLPANKVVGSNPVRVEQVQVWCPPYFFCYF